MTVDGRKVQAGEFIRMYKKSQEPEKKMDIDSYLQQYIVFKLKVAEAINMGYDTTKAFRNELTGYRNQLAQNYLTDTQVKEKLLQEAYERSLTEINAGHILISLKQKPSPEDTLQAWNKAMEVRERIVRGESFEQVARSTSDDKSVIINGGNLGYFTVFQMIKPFEDAAYSLKKGEVSMPVRTPFGYHIIMVTDKCPSKGKIKVAHIMKSVAPGSDEKDVLQAQRTIMDVYEKLNKGASFSELAAQYSDHKESSSKGGELNWFGTGEMISEFSDAAFALTDTGSYTKPVRTIFGWHIIKLLGRKAPESFEESRSYLESKINHSYLNSISKKSFIEKLKKEYNYQINTDAFNWFVKNTDTLIILGLKKYNRNNMPKGNIYSFSNQHFTTREFANYIEKQEPVISIKDPSGFINTSLEKKVSDHIVIYENSLLEKKYPEFRYLMTEFRDGMLLFEISTKKIWNVVNEDSAGLHNYYEKNKNEYLSPRAVEAKIYTLKAVNGEKTLSSAYKKYSKKPDTDRRLLAKFNKKDTLMTIEEGKWNKGENSDIDRLKWNTGVQNLHINGFPALINIKKVIEPVPLKFDEVQGEMVMGYQKLIEDNWVKQLKDKYSYNVDNNVLEEIKRSLNNE